MRVVKKINNNVAVCLDGSGCELIAFGKGIGFPQMPYELEDLSRIDRTFYDISIQFLPLLKDIPEKILMFTARVMDQIQPSLSYVTNPNIVLTLSDHIAFAIDRQRKGIYIKMPPVYELEQNYPLETKVARQFLEAINKEFGVLLPKGEIHGIAMQFINARNGIPEQQVQPTNNFELLLERVTQIIEQMCTLAVRRSSFSYARFATHLEYLLQRLQDHKHISSNNLQMYTSIREEYPQSAACVDTISECLEQELVSKLTEEEKLYLILHVNRICAQESE